MTFRRSSNCTHSRPGWIASSRALCRGVSRLCRQLYGLCRCLPKRNRCPGDGARRSTVPRLRRRLRHHRPHRDPADCAGSSPRADNDRSVCDGLLVCAGECDLHAAHHYTADSAPKSVGVASRHATTFSRPSTNRESNLARRPRDRMSRPCGQPCRQCHAGEEYRTSPAGCLSQIALFHTQTSGRVCELARVRHIRVGRPRSAAAAWWASEELPPPTSLLLEGAREQRSVKRLCFSSAFSAPGLSPTRRR